MCTFRKSVLQVEKPPDVPSGQKRLFINQQPTAVVLKPRSVTELQFIPPNDFLQINPDFEKL
jgi:hypothetical protein